MVLVEIPMQQNLVTVYCFYLKSPLGIYTFLAPLCDPMDFSMLGLPVPHHLQEFAQVHAHCIGDTIQPSHPSCTDHVADHTRIT